MHKRYRIDLDDALPMLAAARAKAEELGVNRRSASETTMATSSRCTGFRVRASLA